MNVFAENGFHFGHMELGVNPSEFWVPPPIELRETSDGHLVISVQVGADLHASEISGYAPHDPATTTAVLDRLHADGRAQYFQSLVDDDGISSYLIHPSPPDVGGYREQYNALPSSQKAAYLSPLTGAMAVTIGRIYEASERVSAPIKNPRARRFVRGAIQIAGGAVAGLFLAGCAGRGLDHLTPSPMLPSPGNTPGLTPTTGETPMLNLSDAGQALQQSLSQSNVADACIFDSQTLADFQAIDGSELIVSEVARFTQVALEHNPPEGLTRFVCDYDKTTNTFVFYFEDSNGQLFSPTRDGLQWLPMVLVDGQLELKTPPPSETVSTTLPPYPDYIPAQGGAIPDWLVPFAEIENASIKESLSKQGIDLNTVELETIHWYAIGANNIPEMRWGTVAWANREHTAVYWTRYFDGIQELTPRFDRRPTGEGARPWTWDTVTTDQGIFIAIYQEGSELPQLLVVDPSKEDAEKGVPVIGQFDTKSELIVDRLGNEVVSTTPTPEGNPEVKLNNINLEVIETSNPSIIPDCFFADSKSNSMEWIKQYVADNPDITFEPLINGDQKLSFGTNAWMREVGMYLGGLVRIGIEGEYDGVNQGKINAEKGSYIQCAVVFYNDTLGNLRYDYAYAGGVINGENLPVSVNGQFQTANDFVGFVESHMGKAVNIRFMAHVPDGFKPNFPIDPIKEPERARGYDYLIFLSQIQNVGLENLESELWDSGISSNSVVLPATDFRS